MRAYIAGLFLLCLWSCLPSVPREDLSRKGAIFFQEREIKEPLTNDSPKESLIASVERSLAGLNQMKVRGNTAGFSKEKFSPEKVSRTLILFREILQSTTDDAEIDRQIRSNFSFWEPRRESSSDSILLTGYFEPILEGSLDPGGEYPYPLYAPPCDLAEAAAETTPEGASSNKGVVQIEDGREVPYYSRREIDTEGVLQGKELELVWLKDPWERYVLHIQGSGQIRLPDGDTLRVGYAASNGRLYRPIGRYLIDRGLLDEKDISMERIREFIQNNPDRAEEIFQYNERYVFFRLLPDSEGPQGALGVPLTPGRSIATDLTIFPPGALAYLVSRQPEVDESGRVVGWKPLRRFVLNQDTGAAIKGPGRVDLFFGSGQRAGTAAGEMREGGRIYFLLAK
ncbi:MAG: MltA domain-containing protein [Deltaproteobacteria bacterium]|nr:MltA domain-containing protein [Deltaproteobacteria bacterium]